MDPLELAALRRAIAAADEPGLVAAWLFGSRARGEARIDSDADVALLYATPPAPSLDALPEAVASAVEATLHADADVVVLNHASPDLVHRVLRDGVLLLDRTPGVRVRFEVRARNEYFDLLPVLTRYRRGRTAPEPAAPLPRHP